jgi:ABC-type branched-chain amino acid transport systems, periplasmic component
MIVSFRACLVSAVAAAGLACAAVSANGQDVKDINVALITPMSGPSMGNQEPAVNSYKIAIEEINRKGIMIAGQKYRFNVKWYDGECKPTAAVTATRAALAQVKPMHIMWSAMCSSAALASRQILLDAKVLALNSVSGTSGFVGPANDPMLFKNKEEFQWRARDLTKYLAAKNLKKGVIIAVNTDWGEESSKMFKKYAAQVGIEIQKAVSFDEHTEEFSPLLAQARQLKPDFIFMASQQLDEQVAFLRAYRQLGFKTQLVGESTWTEDVAEKIGWDFMDGMLTATPWVPSNPRAEVQDYVKKYRAAYGTVPGFNGPPAYDIAFITAQAFEKAGSLDQDKVRAVLRTTEFKNLVYGDGQYRFDNHGQAEFDVAITMFDAKKKLRVIAPKPK